MPLRTRKPQPALSDRKHGSQTGVTLKDIAESLGISHVSVSLALRDSPEISESRRKQVQERALKMGYRPNPMATALAQLRFASKARSVTAELAWINYREGTEDVRRFKEFDLYWKGASETANWFGYNLEEFVCNADFTMARLEKVLSTRGVRGILIPPHSKLPPAWNSFRWDQFSVVRFGHSISNPRAHVVTSDQVTNSLLAFTQIHSKGYRRIAYVSTESSSTRHLGGVHMAQSRLDLTSRLATLFISTHEGYLPQSSEVCPLVVGKKPDAILTEIAEVRDLLSLIGYSVPKDIGLAVFSVLDGNADAGIFQNPAEIGKAAVEMLISLINHNHTGIPKICRELLIEGEWVDGTTLPIRVHQPSAL